MLARADDGRAVPPPGRAPAARGALRGGRAGARARDRADAVRRGLALQPRGRAAARRRAGGWRSRRSTRPSGPTAASPPTTCCAAASGRRSTSRRAPCWPTSARSSSRPATASCSSGSRHLGALMRIEGPDGEVFWLTPGDFERVMRHELASASNDPDQLVALGDRLLGGGHVALAASAAELALAGGEDSARRLGARRAHPRRRSAATCRRARHSGGRPRSIRRTSPSRARSCSARTIPRATCRARTPRCSAGPTRPRRGSCSATSWPRPRSRARRSAPTRTRSISIRRCRAPSTRAKRCACSADHRRRYASDHLTPRGPSRSSRRRERRVDVAPHPGRQMMHVALRTTSLEPARRAREVRR